MGLDVARSRWNARQFIVLMRGSQTVASGTPLLAGDGRSPRCHPFAGQGLCSGLRDVPISPGSLLHQHGASGRPAPDTYQPERDRMFRAIISMANDDGPEPSASTDREAESSADAALLAARAFRQAPGKGFLSGYLETGCILARVAWRPDRIFPPNGLRSRWTVRLD